MRNSLAKYSKHVISLLKKWNKYKKAKHLVNSRMHKVIKLNFRVPQSDLVIYKRVEV